MKKFKPDTGYFKVAVYVLAVICVSIVFYKIVSEIHVIFNFFAGVMVSTKRVLTPFIYAFFIAFIINPIVRKCEIIILKIKPIRKKPKIARFSAALISFAAIIALCVWMVSYMIPDITASINTLFESVEKFASAPEVPIAFFYDIIDGVNEITGQEYTLQELLGYAIAPLMSALTNVPELFLNLLSTTVSVAVVMMNALLGIIIAFYMVLEKEQFALFAKKLLKVIFNEDISKIVTYLAKESTVMFERFFTGKLLDSMIIGVLFYVAAEYILKIPYALFFGLVIGITNMIPYFGPFIGGIPVAVIVAFIDFKLGLWTGLAIFLLQQLDGNVIGPLILGDSTGLKPLDVIFAIIVGGALFGVLGMFLAVPIFAVLKTIVSSIINKRYAQIQEASEEPE